MVKQNSLSKSALFLLRGHTPWLWLNPNLGRGNGSSQLDVALVARAGGKLDWFAPLLAQLFPELQSSGGIIESPLLSAANLQRQLLGNLPAQGRLLLKADHSLPVAGSVKARGGIYEVLVIAEKLAREAGLLADGDNARVLNSAPVRELFAGYTVAVGSTGNLGLSIGVMAAALGFKSVVHMSAEAKQWKKERLRKRGVTVVEHSGDYASAVAAGREQAAADPRMHFVDDENSLDLFLGYSVAALRLKAQLTAAGIAVDRENPLFVYIPCGVGGAPGGITFGLKYLFGDAVHCFFAEPVDSPCMLVQLASGKTSVSIYEIGLGNNTEADGLAVPAASLLVAGLMRPLVAGVFTVADRDLFRWLYQLQKSENLKVEPSATAALAGPRFLLDSDAGEEYRKRQRLDNAAMANATHILWTTGGAFVPEEEYQAFFNKGKELSNN